MRSTRHDTRPGPARWTSIPFPAYAFVPGREPHPRRSPEGHSHGAAEPGRRPLGDWRTDSTFLFGVDLYNHGFWWEAHESWEALWHGEGRRGDTADLLKALIQTSAAHVKARQECAAGVRILSRKSRGILEDVRSRTPWKAGIDLADLIARHRRHFESAEVPDPHGPTFPAIVLRERET